jgi:hypothetical protein
VLIWTSPALPEPDVIVAPGGGGNGIDYVTGWIGPAKERLDLAKAVGADRVLSKPFVQEDRRSAIAAVLGVGRAG